MLRQEASPLHGGILADACGLGNTITALATIVLGNRLPSTDVSPRFAATLILVPNTLIDTWFMEIRRRFGSSLRVIRFYGSSDRGGDPIRKAPTIASLNALVNLLAGLSPLDESTGRTVVLSSYSTWSSRTTTEQSVSTEKSPAAKPKPPKAPRPDWDADIDMDDDVGQHITAEDDARDFFRAQQAAANELKNADEPERATAVVEYVGQIHYRFARVICDEGHRIKTIATRHQSVYLLARDVTWFLTATPMWNRALDMCGFLNLFATYLSHLAAASDGNDGTAASTDIAASDPRLANNAQQSAKVEEHYDWSQKNLPTDSPLPYHLLQLENFAKLGRAGHLDADTGFAALPVVLRMTTLAREPGFRMSGVNLSSITIGGDIPALTVTTVELRYLERYQAEHNPLHQAYVRKSTGSPLSTGETSSHTSDQAGRMNWARFRQLSHVAFSPLLDVFLKRVHNTYSPDIDTFAQRGNDCGFGLFYN